MDPEEYIETTYKGVDRRKASGTFRVEDIGKMGQEIFNDLTIGLKPLVPLSGSIEIVLDLLIKDDNLFKDDEKRKAKVTIRINLGKENGISTDIK